MQAPSYSSKDIAHYAGLILGTAAGFYLLGMVGITHQIGRLIGAIAIGWVCGFVAERLFSKHQADKPRGRQDD